MAEKNQNVQQHDMNQLLQVRRDKLRELQESGRDPFEITKYDVSHHSQEIKDHYSELEGSRVTLAVSVGYIIKPCLKTSNQLVYWTR